MQYEVKNIEDNEVKITDYINNDYKDYALYSVERSIPNIDGLTIVRRKVLWMMYKKHINSYNNRKKISWISNTTSAFTSYPHGEASMEGAINKMISSFTGSNNFALLSTDGQAGNILDPSPGSARYVKAYLNSTFTKMFDKTDLELSKEQFIDGENLEPMYLRPKVPLSVINGSNGQSVGYMTNIYSYNILDVIRIMKSYINDGVLEEDNLIPYYDGYKGKITKNSVTKQIVMEGVYNKIDDKKYIINISEIPIHWTQEKYKQKVLNTLKIKRSIRDYDDDSTPSGWNITLYCSKEFYEQDRHIIMKSLNLIKRSTETLVLNTPNTKNKTYENIVDVIVDFCVYRINWTNERRNKDLSNLEKIISYKRELMRFILFWNDYKDIHLLNKTKLRNLLKDNNFSSVHIEKFLNIAVRLLTQFEVSKLKNEIIKLERELRKLNKTTTNDIINNDLDVLTRSLKSINDLI
jgi:DNA gyrase/topoisomerase IV subunit A